MLEAGAPDLPADAGSDSAPQPDATPLDAPADLAPEAGPLATCSNADRPAIVRFLASMPDRSYRAPPGYWKDVAKTDDSFPNVIERLLVGEDGFKEAGAVNIYDDAVAQTAFALEGHPTEAARITSLLASGMSGELQNIRGADFDGFSYNGTTLPREKGWFFRMRSVLYLMSDPKDGKSYLAGFPDSSDGRLHFLDWKPIAGENAWVIIGALQAEFARTHAAVPHDSPGVKLALSLLDAFAAMQSPTGGIYHAPKGTDGKSEHDISTENNASALAALRMLREALVPSQARPEIAQAIATIDLLVTGKQGTTKVRRGLEDYFRLTAFDRPNRVFWQGGLFVPSASSPADPALGTFTPSTTFAVDVQTWSVATLGPAWVVAELGQGDPSILLDIWARTKEHAGYPSAAAATGVGFSDGHDMFSSEWSFGAILMLKESARYLDTLPESKWNEAASRLRLEASTIRSAIEREHRVNLSDGSVGYKYANRRDVIPFGWWANPIPAKVSAWALFFDCDNERRYFNPFILGGGQW